MLTDKHTYDHDEQPFLLTESDEDENPLKNVIRRYDELLFDHDYPVIGTVDFLGESIPYTTDEEKRHIETMVYRMQQDIDMCQRLIGNGSLSNYSRWFAEKWKDMVNDYNKIHRHKIQFTEFKYLFQKRVYDRKEFYYI